MTKKEVFNDILVLIKEKGTKYKKVCGNWYVYDFDAGFSLVLDDHMEFMSLESGLGKYDGSNFGENVKMEYFFGASFDIEGSLEYLIKIRDKMKEE